MKFVDFSESKKKYLEVNAELSTVRNSKISSFSQLDTSIISAYQKKFRYGNSNSEYLRKEISDLHKNKKNLATLTPLSISSINFLRKKSLFEKLNLASHWHKSTVEISSANSPNRSREIIDYVMEIYEEDIKRFLGSNFVITTLNYSTSFSSTQNNSLYWHFDPTPLGYYKIFFYLDNKGKKLGATEFLDSNTSHQLMQKNYHNIPPENRKKNISGINYWLDGKNINAPLSVRMPGEVVIFNPSITCHRAVYPSRGRREVLVVGLLKSKLNWREAFEDIYQASRLIGHPVETRWPIIV